MFVSVCVYIHIDAKRDVHPQIAEPTPSSRIRENGGEVMSEVRGND